jgi:hypothetical protein
MLPSQKLQLRRNPLVVTSPNCRIRNQPKLTVWAVDIDLTDTRNRWKDSSSKPTMAHRRNGQKNEKVQRHIWNNRIKDIETRTKVNEEKERK